jgi:hypothetical protein
MRALLARQVWQTQVTQASGRPRVGLLRFRDITSTAQPPSQPLRMALRCMQESGVGPAPPGGTVIRHDFRRLPICIVYLELFVRNCTSAAAQLSIQVSHGSHCMRYLCAVGSRDNLEIALLRDSVRFATIRRCYRPAALPSQ